MSTKHTPGPWRTVEVYFKKGRKSVQTRAVVMAGSCRRVADCRDEDEGEPEIDAVNARLIAAAPDLLEMLKDLADPESGCRLTMHALTNIRAAIAKAEGT